MIHKDEHLFNKGEVIHFDIPRGIRLPIYVIGDSHVRVLPEAAPNIFKSSQVDIEKVSESKTAYAVGTEGHERYMNEALDIIPEGSNVLLSFGEIDCRHYVPVKEKQNGTTIKQEVDKIFERYTTNCVRLLKEKFKVTILGAYLCPDDLSHTNEYNDIFQAKYLFNAKMEQYCEENNLPFVPIFKEGIDKQWHKCSLDYPHYFNDSSHLGPCMIPIILETINNHKF